MTTETTPQKPSIRFPADVYNAVAEIADLNYDAGQFPRSITEVAEQLLREALAARKHTETVRNAKERTQ